MVKRIVVMLRAAKKQDKPTTCWLAYNARSNVADVELTSVLDRRIDLVPSLGFLWLSVVCQVLHMGVRSPNTDHVSTAPSPLDQPLVLFQLTSAPLPRNHIPETIGYFPDRVATTMPSQAHAGAAQEAHDIGQWEGQDVSLVRPSSCIVKGGIPSSRRYLPTYLPTWVFSEKC